MQRFDFGPRLLAMAVLVATVPVVLMSSGASTLQATAQSATVTLTTAASPVGCATTTAQISSDTSTVSPGSEWTFPKSSYVTARATVAEGCTFSHWYLDFGGGVTYDFRENPARFQISEDMKATAYLTVPEVCTQTTLGQAPAQVPDLAKDCNILMAAKDALRGTGTLNWSADTAITGWDGVTVSGTPSRVTGLALRLRGLTGSVPAKLGALSALGSLDLSWNKLTGSIPATLGHLGELSSLSLSRTSLGGSIPPELGDLAKLEQLTLSQSFLGGAIPAELGKLTNLEGLYLYQNRLTGSIPLELAELSNLERLYLGENTFTGCLPRALRLVANNDLAALGLESCALPSVSLTYDTYDLTGEVIQPGSHALLVDDTSAATDWHELTNTAAIVVNVSDSGGASRAAFYNSIEVGDVVEWYPVGYEDCWMRYRVTAILLDPPGERARKRLAVEWLYLAHLTCVDDVLTDELEVELRWSPPAARPDPDGGPAIMLYEQPVPGGARYRVAPHSPLEIDVPAGMTLVRYTGWVLGGRGYTVGLEDVATGSYLVLDANTGEELRRRIESSEGDSRDVGALFDAIVASARVVPPAREGQ